jgi:hypothetical protein
MKEISVSVLLQTQFFAEDSPMRNRGYLSKISGIEVSGAESAAENPSAEARF